MEQPDEMPEQPSVAGALPLGRPVVVRSNPFKDIRPFIEHLWKTRTNMCRNIYPDEFPRGTEEKHATKEEEDEFILCYFSADDLHEQGGRFLKQVLYSIAKYNEDNVLSRAAAWAEQYDSFYANPGMSTSQIRNVLDEHEGAHFPDSFLCRAVLVINHGLQQLRDMQNKEATNSTSTERASPPQADLQREQGPVEAPQRDKTFFDAARQASFVPSHLASSILTSTVRNPQQKYMAGLPQSEHIRYGPSLLHGQSRGGRAAASRQPQRQENLGRHRRSSGSMHSPQLPMGPMAPLQQMVPINAATGFPDFDSGPSGFLDAPPGYPPVSYQMPFDDRFAPPNMHANADLYSSISYARAPKPRMPLQIGNPTHQSTNGPGYYTGDVDAQFFQNQIPGSFNQHGSRMSFPQPSNSPRVVDPHSFSRFPEERFSNQRPYAPYGSRGGHRSSFNSGRTRRSSIRSGDGYQGRNHRQSQASSVPDNDPDWSCSSDFIGNRRVDVNTLVVTNLPPEFSVSDFQEYISRVMNNNNKRLVVTCNNTHKSMAFVRFSTHHDAKQALGIRNLTFEGVPVTFKVPFKFWRSTDGKYLPPAHARQCIESGEWYRSKIGNYGPSAGGGHQSRESGRSERSTATSEVGYQLQTPQIASGDESFDVDSNAPVFEDSAASDASDTAAPSVGYNGPVLPSLSEASTPQKHFTQETSQHSPLRSPRKNRIITAVASSETTHSTLNDCSGLDQDPDHDDEQASETEIPLYIDHTSLSDVTSTGTTPATEYVSVESASPSTQRASSPMDAAVIEEPQVDKEPLTADSSTISVSDKRGDSSPKEDADDSFQTAAETPEASTRLFTPRSTPVETKKSGVGETHLATPTPNLPDEKALSTTHSPASITESDDTASISTAGQSLISTMQASDKTAASRSGPKQTESLSPFARQAQAKKKDVKSRCVKSKDKTKTDLEQVKQSKTGAPVSLKITEHGEKKGPKPVESKKELKTELEQFEQTQVDIELHANLSGDLPRHSEDRGTNSVVTENMEDTKNDSSNGASLPKSLPECGDHVDPSPTKSKDEIKTVSDYSKQTKIDAPFNASLTGKLAVHSENNGPRKSKVKVDEGKHRIPTILQPRDVVSRGDQKTLSTLSSVTALLTGALSSIGSSKTKTEIDIPKTSQLGENELTAHTSATVQSDDGGEPTTTTQLEVTTSTTTKKPKKNKNKRKKKKPKNTAPVRDDDVSSTETLAHGTPAGSPITRKASAPPHSPAGGALSERTNTLDKNMMDNHLSILGIKEGSIIELGPNSIGYRATNAGSIGENLNLRGVEGEVEKSRRKMQEMDEKERLLKLRKG